MSWLSVISKLQTWQGGPLAPARMAMSLPSTPSGAIPGRCQGRCKFARSAEKLDKYKLGRFGKSWETSESFTLNLLRSLPDLRISRQMTEGPHQRQTLVTFDSLMNLWSLICDDLCQNWTNWTIQGASLGRLLLHRLCFLLPVLRRKSQTVQTFPKLHTQNVSNLQYNFIIDKYWQINTQFHLITYVKNLLPCHLHWIHPHLLSWMTQSAQSMSRLTRPDVRWLRRGLPQDDDKARAQLVIYYNCWLILRIYIIYDYLFYLYFYLYIYDLWLYDLCKHVQAALSE